MKQIRFLKEDFFVKRETYFKVTLLPIGIVKRETSHFKVIPIFPIKDTGFPQAYMSFNKGHYDFCCRRDEYELFDSLFNSILFHVEHFWENVKRETMVGGAGIEPALSAM